MIKSDFSKIEKLKELIKPAFNLEIIPPGKYHPLLGFQAQRESPQGTMIMVVKIPESDFEDEHCVEAIADAFEASYQDKIKEIK